MQTIMNLVAWALAHPDEAAQALVFITAGIAAIQRWAVAKKRDRLASFADAASRAAGRVLLRLSNLPAGTDPKVAIVGLIMSEAQAQIGEFAGTATKIGATLDITKSMIEGEVGKRIGITSATDAVAQAASAVASAGSTVAQAGQVLQSAQNVAANALGVQAEQ